MSEKVYIVGSECVSSWSDPVEWPEHRLAFMAQPFFQVSSSFLVCGRASPIGRNVSRWSQSGLSATV